MTTSQIDEKHRILLKHRDAQDYRNTQVGDEIQEVEWVDRQNWRPRVVSSSFGSSNSIHDIDVTESEPGQSYDLSNPLYELAKKK